MPELVLVLKVQHVGVLSISYCLRGDIIITESQRQSGRQVWQAIVAAGRAGVPEPTLTVLIDVV